MTDDDGNGRLSRLADEMEAAQLKAGVELFGYSGEMLGDHKVSKRELRFLAKSLREALGDALRVAESRGGRLPACADGSRMSARTALRSLRGARANEPSPGKCVRRVGGRACSGSRSAP
ncbi:hypothetical protein ACFV2X_18235 [Streptomyces sp. NPDC059679]|uniref:hypothetical protein n=1 Tax=Streptomyces sp. NPDC059679 TaxID=3346903 RepID=UPI0036B77D25